MLQKIWFSGWIGESIMIDKVANSLPFVQNRELRAKYRQHRVEETHLADIPRTVPEFCYRHAYHIFLERLTRLSGPIDSL